METVSICPATTQIVGSSLQPINKVFEQFPNPCQLRMQSAYGVSRSHSLSSKQRVGHHALVARCAAIDSGLLAEIERELEAEMKPGEEWMRERCKGRKGMVELLECLETEAIIGGDQGKEPTDYNRRAQIFDKSSRVFQALKERSRPTQSTILDI